MSMMLDPKFRQAMNEGRFTDAATRLVIEEAIGDTAFKGLKAGYNRIPGVKPIVQGINKHIVKPVVKGIVQGVQTNPYARAAVTLGGAIVSDLNRPVGPADERELINMSIKMKEKEESTVREGLANRRFQSVQADKWNNPKLLN